MKLLKNKVALITGGATGIGLATALELAKIPMTIIIASTKKENLNAAAVKIKTAGATDCIPIVCDVSKRESVENLYKESISKFGFVDLLILNAGVTTAGPFLDHRPNDWTWVYDVCLHGPTYFIQYYYPEMCRRKEGHIVLIGSQAGMVPDWFTEHGPYTSAKSGLMALGAALRPEAAEHNVGITNVVVAGVTTEIAKSSQRPRPEGYGDPLEHNVGRREARRIPPEDAAVMIVKGVEENKAWVATHPDLKELTAEYFSRILAAYDH